MNTRLGEVDGIWRSGAGAMRARDVLGIPTVRGAGGGLDGVSAMGSITIGCIGTTGEDACRGTTDDAGSTGSVTGGTCVADDLAAGIDPGVTVG